jgi:formylglycine-generating enzyme required for sulfatase activity
VSEQDFKYANHPRDTVSWRQAMAFCRWFSWRLGGGSDLKKVDEWAVRLPTEFEWEKAARGTDGRVYPYEGDFDATKCNTRETGLHQTSAVGIFPNGASPLRSDGHERQRMGMVPERLRQTCY